MAPAPLDLSSASAAGPGRVTIARTEAALEELATVWSSLQDHPNAEIAFTRALLRSRAPAWQPFVLAWCAPGDRQPRALAIARLAATRLPIRAGYRVLCSPRCRAIEIVQGGLLGVDAEAAAALADAFVAALDAGIADLLRCEHVPVYHPFAVALRARGAEPAQAAADRHWSAAIPRSWDDFLAQLGPNTRRNLRRWDRAFAEEFAGRYRIAVHSRPDALATIAGELESIAQKTYHRALGAGFVDDAERRALLALALQQGVYRAYVLYVDDRPIAYWDGRRCRRAFHTDTTGFLPEYRDHRPGWFLLMKLLQDLCADPEVDRVDFGIGDAQYKEMICNECHDELPLARFARTWRGHILRWLLRTADAATRCARTLLERTGQLKRLKQWWRRRLERKAGPRPS